jgi:hypothetical protein
MISEIFNIIKKYYPDIKADICGCWASEEEMQQLKYFTENTAKDWFDSFQYSATYNVFAVPSDIRDTIGNIRLSSFMHIGFSNDNRDVYYKGGIHSGAARIKSIVNSFWKVDCLGFHTYNESFGDHFNMYASSQLGRNPGLDVDELIQNYCRQMYGLTGGKLKIMTDILKEMEFLDENKAESWLQALIELKHYIKTPFRQSWAFEHILLKAELMSLDKRIGTGQNWKTEQDLKPVENLIAERFRLSERLWRDVYGLGILRHAFIPERMQPDWYSNYMKVFPEEKDLIVPGSVMSRNA